MTNSFRGDRWSNRNSRQAEVHYEDRGELLCGVLSSAPETTDPHKVTCKRCRAKLIKLGKLEK